MDTTRPVAALAARLLAAANATSRHRPTAPDHTAALKTALDTARHTAGAGPQEALPSAEVPALWSVYGRRVWPLGDDITDDRILIEGHDRRSLAALNHYLREGSRPHGPRQPSDRPRVSTARVSFRPTDAEDTLHVTYHPTPTPPPASASTPASVPPSPGGLVSSVPTARFLDVLVADR